MEEMMISQRLKAQLLAVELEIERAKEAPLMQKAPAIERLAAEMVTMLHIQCRAISVLGKRLEALEGGGNG